MMHYFLTFRHILCTWGELCFSYTQLPSKGLSVHQPTILTPEAIHVVDIRHYASVIENICDDTLLPPPVGIYAAGVVEPVLVDGKDYYTRVGTELVPMTDINKTDKAVYDGDGKCVINGLAVKNKKRMLSNRPFLPYRGIAIVEVLIKDQIDSFLSYKKSRPDVWATLSKHFVEQSMGIAFNPYESVGANIELAYSQLGKQIALFLYNKHWYIHNAVRINTHVQIERCMDYRAYQWEMEHGHKFRLGKYTPGATDEWVDEHADILGTYAS